MNVRDWSKRLRKPWVIAGLAVVLLAGAGVFEHFHLKRQLASLRRELAGQGEGLTIAELIPPAPPGDSNAANALLFAARNLQLGWTNLPPMMRLVAPGRAMAASLQNPLVTEDTTNVWPFLQADLADGETTLAGLREAAAGPAISFPLNYSQGFFGIQWPHLVTMKRASQILSAAAMYDLHKNDLPAANSNLCAAIHLVRLYDGEPFIISHLVRLAMLAITRDATWEALQHPGWTDEQLARLQESWARADMMSTLDTAFSMERAMTCHALEEMRGDSQKLTMMVQGGAPVSALDELAEYGEQLLQDPAEGFRELLWRYPGYLAWRWWMSFDDEMATIESLQACIETTRRMGAGDAGVASLPRVATAAR